MIPFETHGLPRGRISSCARKVTATLQEKGYSAYVVGGAVRDLLLGRDPKDFDVATSATPEEVRAVFRRSRIIGRRFRIVHCLCGPETVEVSTFRGPAANDAADATHKDEHGRLLRDNVFGTQEEDAIRRDFTVNALFYDPTYPARSSTITAAGRICRRRSAHDRRPGAALSRGPGAHAARGAARGKARAEIEPGTRKPIKRASHAACTTCPPRAVRRDAEAAPVRARRGMCASDCARKGCTMGCCRCST